MGVVSVKVPFQEGDCLWQVSFPGIGPCKRKLHAESYWTSPGMHVWKKRNQDWAGVSTEALTDPLGSSGAESVTKLDPMGPSWMNLSPYHVVHLPLAYRETLASKAFPEFQRINLIRKIRKCKNIGKQSSKAK